MSVFFNNGPGTTVGIQAETIVVGKGGITVGEETVVAGDHADDEDDEDCNGGATGVTDDKRAAQQQRPEEGK